MGIARTQNPEKKKKDNHELNHTTTVSPHPLPSFLLQFLVFTAREGGSQHMACTIRHYSALYELGTKMGRNLFQLDGRRAHFLKEFCLAVHGAGKGKKRPGEGGL